MEAIRYARQQTAALITRHFANLPATPHKHDKALDALVRYIFSNNPDIKPQGSLYGFIAPQPTAATPPTTPAPVDNSFAGRIVRYMESKGYRLAAGTGQLNIVYVEGCNADGTLNDDKPNAFNDRRLLLTFRNSKWEIVGNWEGTTEPGRHYTVNPMNPKGAARIKFDQYRATWEIGTHGVSVPHEALIQIAPVTVHRDYDKNYIRPGDKLETGLFGINQHGGYDYSPNDISFASAGCLVGRTMAGHREFMAMLKQDPRVRANPKFRFDTTVIPGNELPK